MHNAIKGAGIGIICLGIYFAITSAGSVSPLEQAIVHAFSGDTERSPEEQQKWLQSVDYVSASINVKGYLCAAPIESAKVDADHYGIGCITNRDGTGRSNYLVNFPNGNVQPI